MIILRPRSRNLAFFICTWIIKLLYTWPSLIIAEVVIMLRTSFSAVPAFMRVEPVITSGPTIGAIETSAISAILDLGLQVMLRTLAPMDLPYLIAPMVNGVLPLAAIPATTSLGLSLFLFMAVAPAASSSSIASIDW